MTIEERARLLSSTLADEYDLDADEEYESIMANPREVGVLYMDMYEGENGDEIYPVQVYADLVEMQTKVVQYWEGGEVISVDPMYEEDLDYNYDAWYSWLCHVCQVHGYDYT